jgi:hypothetical protein
MVVRKEGHVIKTPKFPALDLVSDLSSSSAAMPKPNISPTRKRRIAKPTSNQPSASTSFTANSTQHGRSSVEAQSKSGGSSRISPLDILRVLSTLLALAFSLSYYLTSGDSLTFNYRPWFTHINQLRAYAVSLAPFRSNYPSSPTHLSLILSHLPFP